MGRSATNIISRHFAPPASILSLTQRLPFAHSFEDPHWSIYDDVIVVDKEENRYNKRWNLLFGAILGVAVGVVAGAKYGHKLKLSKT